MTAEIIRDLPASIYHSRKAISASGMRDFLKSPRYYRAMQDKERETTPSMTAGTIMHAGILEPHVFQKRYVRTDLDRRGTKEWKAQESMIPGRELIKAADYDRYCECIRAVRENKYASELLTKNSPETEVSIFWKTDLGLDAKARLDLVAANSHIVDVKITDNADKFERTAFTYGYHRQAAWYLTAAKAAGLASEGTPFYFLVIEAEFPFEIRIYEASEEIISQGNLEIHNILLKYSECLKSGEWTDKTGPWRMKLPRWLEE